MSVAQLRAKPLNDLGTMEQGESSKTFIKIEPVYLNKLSERLKVNEIADMLGYSSNAISGILNGGEDCRKVIEVAAKGIYEERFGVVAQANSLKPICAFISGDLKLMKMVQSMVDIGAGKFTYIEAPV